MNTQPLIVTDSIAYSVEYELLKVYEIIATEQDYLL